MKSDKAALIKTIYTHVSIITSWNYILTNTRISKSKIPWRNTNAVIEMYSEYYAVFAYIRVFHREASYPSPKLQVAIASFSTGFYFNEVALDVNPGINFEERKRKIVCVCVYVLNQIRGPRRFVDDRPKASGRSAIKPVIST